MTAPEILQTCRQAVKRPSFGWVITGSINAMTLAGVALMLQGERATALQTLNRHSSEIAAVQVAQSSQKDATNEKLSALDSRLARIETDVGWLRRYFDPIASGRQP